MRLINILVFLLFTTNVALAQYTSPNTSQSWNLDSLVQYSSGVVVKSGANYQFLQNVVISATDTVRINNNARLEFALNVELKLLGTLIINPIDSVVITAINSTQLYKPLRFDGSNNSYINKCIVEYGGGFKVLDSDFTIENSVFRFNASGSAGAIDLFRSDLIIRNNFIHDNVGPAVASGANVASAPQILNNRIVNNVSGGSNKSQINFGTTGSDTIKIYNNDIIGSHTNAGGIAVLAIGGFKGRIDSNFISNNRYGIAVLSSPSYTIISNNTIENNDTQNDPNLGGSGLNFNGNSTNVALISGNKITGNLWGITIQGTAKPNLGNLKTSDYNIGKNHFGNNGNGGQLYNLFNNTPDSIFAQNNIWDAADLVALENTISHKVDDPNLGYVLYNPVFQLITGISKNVSKAIHFQIFPNPSEGVFYIQIPEYADSYTMQIRDISGRVIKKQFLLKNEQAQINMEGFKGVYFVELISGKEKRIQKVVLH